MVKVTKFRSKWQDFPRECPSSGVPKVPEPPFGTFGTAIVERSRKNDGSPGLGKDETAALLYRLRVGSQWLADNHQLWLEDDTTAADDAAFSRAWADWWELDRGLREQHGYTGCIHGPEGDCPEGFSCRGCSEIPGPSAAAQLALVGAIDNDGQ